MPGRSWCAAAAVFFVLATGVPAASASTPDALAARANTILTSLPASAVAIVDPTNGRLLYGKRADTPFPAASLLKMVTAIVVAQKLQPQDTLTISEAAGRARDDQIAWRQGATFTVDQVLHGMLMESSNGAAIALAERVAGTLPAFARMANARARQLGAQQTVIVDPSGLDAPGQHATARDLALIASAFLKIPWLAHVAVTKTYSLPWPDGTTAQFHNLDRFVNQYPGAVGVKNGYTSFAGNCVAAAATRNGKTLIVVALNGPHIYDTASRLMDAGFATATIGTWQPDPLPTEVAPGVAAAATPAAATTAEPTANAAATTTAAATAEPTATVKHHRHPLLKLVVFVLALAYVARFVQIRRRKIRRRRAMRAQRLARVEVTRKQIEARYSQKVRAPRALPLRESQHPRSGASSSR
jgi:D-alanyl-D-alanine carboxypeptidase